MHLFNLPHTLYVLISGLLTAVGLILAAKYCRTEKQKDAVLKISALTTVALHYSNLWVDFFTTGTATMGQNQLLAVYPCNVMMWLLLVVAFLKKKDSLGYTILAESVFWVGTICGVAGILFNVNYSNNPDFSNYGIVQGFISHSTMVFGCIYMLVGKYVRIRVFNVFSSACCLILFVIDGAIVNGLFSLCGIPAVNAMFLQEPPFPELPWLNPLLFGVVILAVFFGALALYEWKCFPPEERWYEKCKRAFHNADKQSTKELK